MQLFLTVLAVSMVGMMLTLVAFQMVAGEEEIEEDLPRSKMLPVPAGQFFLHEADQLESGSETPVSAPLHQLERHVRSEHFAAEEFLEVPTAESLHARPTSPLED